MEMLLVYKFGHVNQLWVLDNTKKEIWSKCNLCVTTQISARKNLAQKDPITLQSPAGTSPEQPQIATMKEKPSLLPKRESRALQTRFGGTE